jgi:hypothetical protein
MQVIQAELAKENLRRMRLKNDRLELELAKQRKELGL